MSWAPTRLRYVADLNPAVRHDLLADGIREVSFLPMEAVGEDGSLDLSRTRPVAEVRNGYSYFEDGDVTFAKVTPCFENGKGGVMRGLIEGAGFGTTELTVLRPRPGNDARFLRYFLCSSAFMAEAVGAMSGAGGLKRVPDWFVRDYPASWPVPSVQSTIANFLDEQTARIDALIAEKERLVDKLAELEHSFGDELFRRRARERGQVRLKYRSPQITVGIVVTPAKYYVDTGVPSLRSLNVGQGVLNSESLVFISSEANELHSKSKLFEGDIVVVRSGKPGAAAVVTKEFDGGNCIDLVIIRRSPRLNSDWLRAYLNSAPALEQITDASEGAIQQHFNVSSARELRIPDSPPEEQAIDLATMNEKQEAVRQLTMHALSHSKRLQEYRSSLITAAVTGQLDISTFKLAA